LRSDLNDLTIGAGTRKTRTNRRGDRLKIAEAFSLRDLPLFASVDEETLSTLALEAKVETCESGTTIFRQGDPIASIVAVIKGYVKLLRIAPGGDETLIAIRANGETIVDPVMGPEETCGVSAETIGPATIIKVPAARFARLARESAGLGAAVAQDATRRIAALVSEIEALKSQNADLRLAHFILSLCPPGEEQCRFRLPYDKRLIAALLGVKQETLSRAFAKLREHGVRTETRDIVVESVARLVVQCEHLGRATLLPERTGRLTRDDAA
jgi:CRP-like cAMP-binding protein